MYIKSNISKIKFITNNDKDYLRRFENVEDKLYVLTRKRLKFSTFALIIIN